jgi:sugar lactone lactonase YvrE
MLALLPGRIMAQAETPGASTTPATTPVSTAVTTPQPAGTTTATSTVPITILADLDPGSATGIRPEGLIADANGRLYTSDTASRRLYRLTPDSPQVTVLGTLPAAATGMAFDSRGNLYLASSGNVLRIAADKLSGDSIQESDVQTFATGVAGANGLIFDAQDRLYVSGAATGNIYVVATDGMTRTFATGFRSERQDQQISTNGLAFGPDGRLYSANTGTGAIDRITVNADGTAGPVERWVTDPLLRGADGIAFASNGDLYVAANERNAVVRVTADGQVSDVASNGNAGPLEFPASLAFSGSNLYASNFDIERGANSPAAPGIGASVAQLAVGVTGYRPPVIGDAVSATAPPQATPVPLTPTTGVIDYQAPTPVVEPEITPVGMPRTGSDGSDSLLWTMLAALSGLLLLVGALARRSYASTRK